MQHELQQFPPVEIPNLYSIPEAANRLGVTRPTIYKYIRNGTLKWAIAGGKRYLFRDEVEALRSQRRLADVNTTS